MLIFEWDPHNLMRDNAVNLFGDTELATVFSYTDEVLGKMREDDKKIVQFVRESLSS
jgi:hypothetical protein